MMVVTFPKEGTTEKGQILKGTMEETKLCFDILNWRYWRSKQVQIPSIESWKKKDFKKCGCFQCCWKQMTPWELICGGERHLSREVG